ncbi:MAG TPA: hypothetical protein V6C86_23165 [Oculatellaceae cyanobacterium]
MLRELLQRIFSAPHATEDRRIQEQDLARLRQHIKTDHSDEQICNIEHGPLSMHHWQHMPLKRSVSQQASQSAYERYLQHNAAKADNWTEFDELLYPTIARANAATRPPKFLTEEEENDLAKVAMAVATAQPQPLRMEPKELPRRKIVVTAELVQKVEMVVLKQATSGALAETVHWHFGTATKTNKNKRRLPGALAYKCGLSWLKKQAADSTNTENILRQLAQSMLLPVRAAVASNDRIPFDCIWTLGEDQDSRVRKRIAMNPSSSIELLERLSHDRNEAVSTQAKKVLKTIIG